MKKWESEFFVKNEMSKKVGIQRLKKVVTQIFIYGGETWTIIGIQKQKMATTEMRLLRKIENKTKINR